ncbi:hypothetical protein TNCV_4957791 [Trichonephila clavipes]|nr:hypothetical protein TNCV_4957791 [Trichonephila clavipes]
MDNRNEPTDMDLIDSPRRTPTPPPLSAWISNKRKEESDFEYPPLRKTTKSKILNIPNDSISISPNRFSLPSDSNIEEITGSQNAIPVVTPKPPSATGPTPSGNQTPLTNRKYFGRFQEEHGSGLSGYPEAFDRVWILGLTFKLITYDIPSPHSPHPLVSH